MSVLKSKRTESKAEYVNVANAIYIETINFLTRISARYSRLIAEPVAKLAGEVIDHAEKANSIYPSDDQRRQLRKAHLLEARASLMALDVRLTHCYLIMTQNPQGCFTTPSGKSVDAKKATERLDKMAQKLGELIDKENDLLQGMIGTVNRTACFLSGCISVNSCGGGLVAAVAELQQQHQQQQLLLRGFVVGVVGL